MDGHHVGEDKDELGGGGNSANALETIQIIKGFQVASKGALQAYKEPM